MGSYINYILAYNKLLQRAVAYNNKCLLFNSLSGSGIRPSLARCLSDPGGLHRLQSRYELRLWSSRGWTGGLSTFKPAACRIQLLAGFWLKPLSVRGHMDLSIGQLTAWSSASSRVSRRGPAKWNPKSFYNLSSGDIPSFLLYPVCLKWVTRPSVYWQRGYYRNAWIQRVGVKLGSTSEALCCGRTVSFTSSKLVLWKSWFIDEINEKGIIFFFFMEVYFTYVL